ncbi:hypothetical protein [Yonghaparkia sp. Soil809]|uniref:hypothetical protein n=1 Tax=Yonghaparkia sp. Soil809 TaxID=1736417 RepID=UPI0006F9372B|nr:hypothetical protein [Yonghaparkia sp. Soil809]KRF30785.1 hypothetical protein ASG83_07900 [Yonghaparkia sp. Soil809]
MDAVVDERDAEQVVGDAPARQANGAVTGKSRPIRHISGTPVIGRPSTVMNGMDPPADRR